MTNGNTIRFLLISLTLVVISLLFGIYIGGYPFNPTEVKAPKVTENKDDVAVPKKPVATKDTYTFGLYHIGTDPTPIEVKKSRLLCEDDLPVYTFENLIPNISTIKEKLFKNCADDYAFVVPTFYSFDADGRDPILGQNLGGSSVPKGEDMYQNIVYIFIKEKPPVGDDLYDVAKKQYRKTLEEARNGNDVAGGGAVIANGSPDTVMPLKFFDSNIEGYVLPVLRHTKLKINFLEFVVGTKKSEYSLIRFVYGDNTKGVDIYNEALRIVKSLKLLD